MTDLASRADKAIRASIADHEPCLPVEGNRHHAVQALLSTLLKRHDVVSCEAQPCRGYHIIGGVIEVDGKRESFLFTVTQA